MSAPGQFSDPPPLTPDDLKDFFPLQRPNPLKPGAFEFALTLAGTVSAGAYTAGVLDFILEALDLWQRTKQDGNKVEAPDHEAILSTITGASGGAINAAILLRVAGYGFPHGDDPKNPFYAAWVNGVDINALLAPDSEPNGLASLFNTQALKDLADNLIKSTGPALGSDNVTPTQRSFFADPLRLCAMVGNVTGLPYQISFRGQTKLGHDLVGHADYVRFGLTVPGGAPNSPVSRPDEYPLASDSPANWSFVSDTALCTSAFPAAFPSRQVARPLGTVGYRVAVVPGVDQNQAEVAQLIPLWQSLSPAVQNGVLTTVNVDGGTVNNEPLDLARVMLAGYNGRNKRGADNADRAVVLIDPFSDPESLGPSAAPGFLDLLGPLVSTLVYQARMKPEDIALANDYDTYSRFLVAPDGPGGGVTPIAGSKAIAAGGLGGFLGFISRDLLRYDFLLGRRNAYEFLRNEFVLAGTHPLFAKWTDDQRAVHKIVETNPTPARPSYYLPIIPLMPALRAQQPELAPWPRQNDVPANLASNVSSRLSSVYAGLKKDLQRKGVWPNAATAFLVNQAWNLFLRGVIRDKIVKYFRDGLNSQNLLTVTTQTWPLSSPSSQALAKAAQSEWLAAGAVSSTLTQDTTNWILETHWK